MKSVKPFCALILSVALFSACGGSQTDAPSTDEDVFTIGMSQCNLGEPWRVQMNADIKAAAELHSNIKMIFKDAQNDSLKQRAHVEEYVSAEVDLIIISPKEAQPLTGPVATMARAGRIIINPTSLGLYSSTLCR